jgi:hypothetical protein
MMKKPLNLNEVCIRCRHAYAEIRGEEKIRCMWVDRVEHHKFSESVIELIGSGESPVRIVFSAMEYGRNIRLWDEPPTAKERKAAEWCD